MNRKKLVRYLISLGCSFERHGSGHDVWWNVGEKRTTSIPRHKEIDPGMTRTICKQLDVPPPPENCQ